MSTPELVSRTYGPLTMLERPAADTTRSATPTVVMAHGFGANAWDLAPLADVIDRDGAVRWLFPHGPASLAAVAGQTDIPEDDFRKEIGRAWFPRAREELAAALYGAYFATIVDQSPQSLQTAGDELLAAISEATGSSNPLSGVIIGGFSQGAMVAIEAVLKAKEPPAGLVVLSGNPIDRERWKALFGSFAERNGSRDLRYFQSHGTSDPVLSYQFARDLNDMLTRAGFIGEFQHFPGGHWIPEEVMWSLSEFLFSL